MNRFLVLITIIFTLNSKAAAEVECFIGTSAFTLLNLDTKDENPPHFYQLNWGVRLNKHSSISLEWITWRYYSPLGIPYGENHGKKEHQYPGYIKASGLGLAYQYVFKNNWFTSLHTQWMKQTFMDKTNNKIGTGNQLFITARLGYQIRFMSNRLFIEPNIAITHWPINTNLPLSFKEKEKKWNNYFLFEPGLHVGLNF